MFFFFITIHFKLGKIWICGRYPDYRVSISLDEENCQGVYNPGCNPCCQFMLDGAQDGITPGPGKLRCLDLSQQK